MDRLKTYFKLNSDRQVAEKLGINYNTIKTWGNRKKIPMDTLLNKLQNETIDLNWLLTGEGEMYKNEKIIINAPNNIVNSHNAKISINEAINSLPPEIATVAKYMLNLPEKQRLEFIACIFSKCGKE